MCQVIIVGGGLAGILNAILLTKAGVSCLVIEKKAYPFHKVCGEFISNEVKAFLILEGLYPEHLSPAQINRLLISSTNGKVRELALTMGGFGVSRYRLEQFWYQKAQELGIEFHLNTSVVEINYQSGYHRVKTSKNETYRVPVVIGAYGKRTSLDRQLKRPFISKRSAYVGVKYHMSMPWDPGLIALHAFDQGYCGISMIEEKKVNLCYLSSRSNLLNHGSIDLLEKNVLSKNPQLAPVFKGAKRLFKKPLVINEISFEPKKTVVDHVLMSGDAAGMITPLCGNGMAMAIHSAVLLAPRVAQFLNDRHYSRARMESDYSNSWQQHFSQRLSAGRFLQKVFFLKPVSSLLVQAARFPLVADWIVRQTHGKKV
jgi:flavin-dependent dehydrogenase